MTKREESRALTLIYSKSLDELTNAGDFGEYKGKAGKK